MSLAALTCPCGVWVTLRLDSDHLPVSWSLLGPELFADATNEPAPESTTDEWSADIAEHVQQILEDADDFTEQVGRSRISEAGFTPNITCFCDREFAALTVRPWIVETPTSNS